MAHTIYFPRNGIIHMFVVGVGLWGNVGKKRSEINISGSPRVTVLLRSAGYLISLWAPRKMVQEII